MTKRKEQKPIAECVFLGKEGQELPKYPCWRYHRILDPLLVKNTEEDLACREQGYDDPMAPLSANKQFQNWYWDIEDMSEKQLVVFAMDEFGVELPIGAIREILMRAVTKLSRNSPMNKDRLVLLAQTLQMNYDATIKEIERLQSVPVGGDYIHENESEVFYA